MRRFKSQADTFGASAVASSPSRNGQESSADNAGTNADSTDAHIEQTLAQVMQNQFRPLLERLDKIEGKVTDLLQQRTVKDWYSTEEAAKILGKAEYTIREHCRQGRVRAEKKGSGRGKYKAWVISNDELKRIQKDGLLLSRR